jgi:hypothetical protein
MAKRYRVDGETIRLEARDGAASIALELSRAGPQRASPGDPGVIRSGSARAVCTGPGRSTSCSKAASVADGQESVAAAGGLRRKVKLSD